MRFFIIIANSEPSPSSLTASSVRTYLGEHPEFLDSYIEQNVHTNTIEQWLSKRPQKKSSISSSTSTSTPIGSSNKNNTSTSIIKSDGKIF